MEPIIDPSAYFKLTYGLFVLTAREGEKDNGCIINTLQQLTGTPGRVTIAVNKQDYTHDMILRTGTFAVSALTQDAPFSVFRHFGFRSGRDVDKFSDYAGETARAENGVRTIRENTNMFLAARVQDAYDYGTHTLFVAETTQAQVLSDAPSLSYAYYFAHIKPKPQSQPAKKKGFICKICGYIYEGETLPPDFICPICKHGAADFEPLPD